MLAVVPGSGRRVLLVLYLALCLFSCRQAQDALHHGWYGSEVQLCPCLYCLLVSVHLALFFFPYRQAQDALHHGRFGCTVMSVLGRFAGDNAPRAVFSSLFDKPMMLGIMAVTDKKDSYALFLVSGIACVDAPRAVFSSLVHKPMMLCIVAGMLQNDSCLRRTGKLDYFVDGGYFSSAPCIWKSLVRVFA